MMNLYLAIAATIVLILVIFTFQDQPKALSKKELAELTKKEILDSYYMNKSVSDLAIDDKMRASASSVERE